MKWFSAADAVGATTIRNALFFVETQLVCAQVENEVGLWKNPPEMIQGLSQAVSLLENLDDGNLDGRGFRHIP